MANITTSNETDISPVNVTTITASTFASLFIVFIIAVVLSLFVWKQKKAKRGQKTTIETSEEEMPDLIPKRGSTRLLERQVTKESVLDNLWHCATFDDDLLPAIKKSCIEKRNRLGEGNFGVVYEGLMTQLPKAENKSIRVAIKTLRPNHTQHLQGQFLKEAQIQKNFKHENIVKFLGVCIQSDDYWMVFELMDDTLLHYLQSVRPTKFMPSQVTLSDLLKIIRNIVDGCVYLEVIQRIHRDLAARNCLVLLRDGKVHVTKIADFGISHKIYPNDFVELYNSFIPYRWAAPECFLQGPYQYSQKVDIWSFGVLDWEIMTLGRTPYENYNREKFRSLLSFLQQGGRLEKPDYCPDEMYEIMNMCWNLDPSKRPSFMLLKLKFETLKWFEQYQTDKRSFPPFFPDDHQENIPEPDNDSQTDNDGEDEDDLCAIALTRVNVSGEQRYVNVSGEPRYHLVSLQNASQSPGDTENESCPRQRTSKEKDAFCLTLSDELAIRIIPKETVRDQSLFDTEIEQLKKLDHPNLVRLLDVFSDSQCNYFLLGPTSPTDLFSRLIQRNIPYTEAKAANLLKQMFSAIGYMHENNIIHGDLKPENIYFSSVDENSRIVISGFALSSVKNTSSQKEKYGFLNYFAPEVLVDGKYEKPMDIWSLGVIAFIMLSGVYPFNDKDKNKIRRKIITGSFTFDSLYWREISELAKQFINRLLQVKSAMRLSATLALEHPWINNETTTDTDVSSTIIKRLRHLWAVQKWMKAINAASAIRHMQNLRVPRSPIEYCDYFTSDEEQENEGIETLPAIHSVSISQSDLHEIFDEHY